MRFYWVKEGIQQNHLHIFWEEGKKNLADYVTKKETIWHHRAMRPRYVKATKKDVERSKYRQTGTRRGFSGPSNPSKYVEPNT